MPELLPIRHGRMLASPFAFFRGAALVMAHDLASTPNTGLGVQLCGDAHLMNFGGFGSPERQLVFDLNDFDETLPGPWEWDLKRLAASLAVAGRECGFTDAERRTAVQRTARTYREVIGHFASMGNLAVWYSRLDAATLRTLKAARVGGRARRRVRQTAERARAHDHVRAFSKLTTVVDGTVRLVSRPPLVVRLAELLGDDAADLSGAIAKLIAEYARSLPGDRRVLLDGFRVQDMALKVVGVGSVGTRCWVVLLRGRDHTDPLFLQVKEAGPSVLEPFLGKSTYANHGQRVVEGQRLMQAVSDVLLGWVRTTGIDGQRRDFYVRQLWDWKGSIDVTTMVPLGMALYGEVCAWTLARAHARSGDRVAIAGYLGSSDAFDRAMASFAESYADQNERDYDALRAAVRSGRLAAAEGL